MTDQDRIAYIYEKIGALSHLLDAVENLRVCNVNEHSAMRSDIKSLCETLGCQQTAVATHIATHETESRILTAEKKERTVALKAWQVVLGVIGIVISLASALLAHFRIGGH